MLTEQKNSCKTFEDYLVACVTKGIVEMVDADMLKKMQDECEYFTCFNCDGVGTKTRYKSSGRDSCDKLIWTKIEETCTACNGTGIYIKKI